MLDRRELPPGSTYVISEVTFDKGSLLWAALEVQINVHLHTQSISVILLMNRVNR